MNIGTLLIPVNAALIGWFTTWISVKLLFHPKKPIKILGVTFQGIFPKHQLKFGEKLGKLISEEFLSFDDIEEKIANPANLAKIMPEVDQHFSVFLREKLPKVFPMLSMFIGEKTIGSLKEAFMDEFAIIFPDLMKKYAGSLKQDLDLELIVQEKVKGFSSDKMEIIMDSIMAKEFRFLEILGGIFGFIIGCLQMALAIWLK
jgi:uncharacterized membrane protein YheB (UPF0754 family)